MTTDGNQKKRHHYVPVTYLSRFTDPSGRIFAYRKDGPFKPLHLRPSEIAFERYYYSQPLPEGGRDNNRLEDAFSKVESEWPALVDDLTAGRDVGDRVASLFEFIGLLRVRGPAARDPVELHLAHLVRRQMLRLDAQGELPPLPQGLTFDDIDVSIDPHQSLHAMVTMLRGFSQLLEYVGLEVVHNTTSEPFATSDNPVVIFDPDVPEAAVLPYTVRPPQGRIELLLPISPRVMLRGSSGIRAQRPGERFRHVEMSVAGEVRRVNRFMARFGYRFVFADHGGLDAVVAKYAPLSPTVRFDTVAGVNQDELEFVQMIFGPRPRKPKWRP